MKFKTSEIKSHYHVDGIVSGDDIITKAKQILNRRFARGRQIQSPEESSDFLILKLAHLEHECFSVIFLDNQHHVIAYEELFRGTVDSATVHPREVIKRALALNAAAVILAHNHLSGNIEPSQSDVRITQKLMDALSLIDIKVLDHIVIGSGNSLSMAERGLI